MNKAEFLLELEKRLHVLNEQERRDVLQEYAQHIDLKIENGLNEEEAVRDFGSPEELAAELLDAYRINAEYAGGSDENHGGGSHEGRAKAICRTVSKAVSGTAEKTGAVVQSAGKAAGQAVSGLLHLIKRFWLFCLGLVSGVCVWIGKLFRRITGRPSPEEVQSEQYQVKEEQRRKQKEEKTELRRQRRIKYEEEREKRREMLAQRRENGEVSTLRRIWNQCVRFTKWCVQVCWKMILLGAAAPFFLCGLFFLFCTGVLAVLILQEYPVIGIGIASLGCVFVFLGFTGILLSWVFTGKKK